MRHVKVVIHLFQSAFDTVKILMGSTPLSESPMLSKFQLSSKQDKPEEHDQEELYT
jgi:hypothetical protein